MQLTGGHAFIFQVAADKQAALAQAFALSAMGGDEDAQRRVRTHNHPDVLTLAPEGATIKIRQARQLIDQLANKPFEGKNRVVCILSADTMTQEAQNCLLKTLEEPPTHTMFGLFCEQPGRLLETVRSRCVWLRQRGQSDYNEMDTAPLAAFCSALSLEQAKQCFPDKKDPALICLAAWMDSVSGLLPMDSRPAPFAHCDDSRLADLAQALQKAYRMTASNVSAKMVAEWLWIQWKEDKA